MSYLYSIGGILALLYAVYAWIQSVKSDEVLSQLNRRQRTEEDDLIAKSQQELEDAKIHYAKSRAEFDKLPDDGTKPVLPD